ncbi:MAG: hypothetical protein ACON4W_07015 [Parvibaculales bacterium]
MLHNELHGSARTFFRNLIIATSLLTVSACGLSPLEIVEDAVEIIVDSNKGATEVNNAAKVVVDILQDLDATSLIHNLESEEAFDPSRLALVDNVNGVLLFRSNLPAVLDPQNSKVVQSFDYDQLVSAMKQVSAAQNVPFPDQPYIVDISLLNDVIEAQTLEVEQKFFENNPNLGEFINYPIFGALLPPNDFPDSVANPVAINTPVDDLPNRVQNIRNMMQNARPGSVFVVHCNRGQDRTGEVIGAYSIEFLGMTLDQYLATATQDSGKAPNTLSQNGIKWFQRSQSLANNSN